MATKLKNLKIKKVDFVDEGANQRADIKLLKSKNGEDGAVDSDITLFQKFKKWLKGEMTIETEEIEKSATSFEEQITSASLDQIRDEIWSVCYALQSSFNSIISDEELGAEEKRTAMESSADQFNAAVKAYAEKWCSGTTASIKKGTETPDETDMLMINKSFSNLEEIINKLNEKGELEDMLKIDKSKMTAEERAAYDDIIKKYAVETEGTVEKKVNPEENQDEIEDTEKKGTCKKSIVPPVQFAATSPSYETADDGDIYKGLHPVVKAQLEEFKKFRETTEERELAEVAKKYTAIGKKPEELVPLLKSLRAAGGTAYADMITMMDACVEAQNQSGLFSEIGKSGSYKGPVGIAKSTSEIKIDQIAKAYLEKEPNMTMTEAVAKAWEDHPELMADYEEEAGF